MKFSLSWVSEHIDFESHITIENIGNSLTSLGLEVESITDPSKGLEDFTEVGEATQMESMSLKKLIRKLDPKKQYHVEYRNKKDNFISTTISGIESK